MNGSVATARPATSTSGGIVDTELPAAAALADAAANPTAPAVAAHNLVWNGTTWDRQAEGTFITGQQTAVGTQKSAPLLGDTSAGYRTWDGAYSDTIDRRNTGAVCPMLWNGTAMERSRAATADTLAATGLPADGNMVWNASSWDRLRNNIEGQILASAARTANPGAVTITNYNARAFYVHLNVTAQAGGSITVAIDWVDSVAGTSYNLLTGTAVTTVSTTTYRVGPGLTAAANLAANEYIGRTLRVTVTHNNGSSITYSVGYLLAMA
jgi:hypothetical protein